MFIMFTVFGQDYSMPTYLHTFAEPIKNCWVELIEPTNSAKFFFIVKDCDHPTIQHRFSCLWYEISDEIEKAVLLVVAQRDVEFKRIKELFQERMHDEKKKI